MKQLHLVMQRSFGVGKTYIAWILSQYFKNKDDRTLVIDTNQLNPTLSQYQSLEPLTLFFIQQNRVEKTLFDAMMRKLNEADSVAVIDSGGYAFDSICHYFRLNDTLLKLKKQGFNDIIVHCVLCNKSESDLLLMVSTLDDLASLFHSEITLCVWLNEYYGKIISSDGVRFEESVAYHLHRKMIRQVLILEELDQLTQRDLESILEERQTFLDTLSSKRLLLVSKSRLYHLKERYFSKIASIA